VDRASSAALGVGPPASAWSQGFLVAQIRESSAFVVAAGTSLACQGPSCSSSAEAGDDSGSNDGQDQLGITGHQNWRPWLGWVMLGGGCSPPTGGSCCGRASKRRGPGGHRPADPLVGDRACARGALACARRRASRGCSTEPLRADGLRRNRRGVPVGVPCDHRADGDGNVSADGRPGLTGRDVYATGGQRRGGPRGARPASTFDLSAIFGCSS